VKVLAALAVLADAVVVSPAVVAVRNTRTRLLKSSGRSLFPFLFVLLSAIVCFPIPNVLSLDIRDRHPFLIRMSRILILIFFIFILAILCVWPGRVDGDHDPGGTGGSEGGASGRGRPLGQGVWWSKSQRPPSTPLTPEANVLRSCISSLIPFFFISVLFYYRRCVVCFEI
jgi:hypothetical protein